MSSSYQSEEFEYTNIGNRVVHFNPQIDPSCIFCVKNRILPAQIESFEHVFFSCPVVNTVLSKFYEKYLNIALSINTYFTSEFSTKETENRAVNIILDVLRYSIWQQRLLKSSPSFHTVEIEVQHLPDTITTGNKALLSIIENCPFVVQNGGRA